MTDIEKRFIRATFEHADKLPPEFWQLFWPWYTRLNLRDDKKNAPRAQKEKENE